MTRAPMRHVAALAVMTVVLLPAATAAQGASADYERALALRERYEGAALNIAGAASWIGDAHAFWYRRSVKGGFEFIRIDADSREERPLFDHAQIAAALSKGTGRIPPCRCRSLRWHGLVTRHSR